MGARVLGVTATPDRLDGVSMGEYVGAQDVASRGSFAPKEVGELCASRASIRQVEVRSLLKLKMASPSPEELGKGSLAGN